MIVEGIQLVRPGQVVEPVEVPLDQFSNDQPHRRTTPIRDSTARSLASRAWSETGAARTGKAGPEAEEVPHPGAKKAALRLPRPNLSTTIRRRRPRKRRGRNATWSISSSGGRSSRPCWPCSCSLIGGICIFMLPIAQYPEITPPQVQVTTTYTGADALTVAETVTTPIEQQINGVKGMIYFNSDSTSNGVSTIVATFDVGYSQDIGAVDIQNRVQTAQAVLPPEVKQFGVTIKKTSTDMVCVVNLVSPDGRYDATYLDNYAQIYVLDVLEADRGGERRQRVRAQVRHADLARPRPDGQPAHSAVGSDRRDPGREPPGGRGQDRRPARCRRVKLSRSTRSSPRGD